MTAKKHAAKDPADYIMPLNMNGLQGRMLYLPPRGKNKEILFVYGHHSTIERWWELTQELNKFGAVTVPDLPGFGGMENLYKIGERPTVDRYAAYLASFIKLRYKRRRLTIVGVGFGFVAVTRMLQRYPDIAKKVDLVVSLAALTHHDDFGLSAKQRKRYCAATYALSMSLPAALVRYIYLRPRTVRRAYAERKSYMKYRRLEASVFKTPTSLSVELWQQCDVRTHMATLSSLLTVDNCQSRVAVPAWHVSVAGNKYLNEHLVEQHFRVVFEDFHQSQSKLAANETIDDPRSAAHLIPPKLRRALAKS